MMNPVEHVEEHERLPGVIAEILEILEAMGCARANPASLLSAPAFYREESLLEGADRFSEFAVRFGMKFGCIPYAAVDAAFVSIEDFARRYLRDSFPEIPSERIQDEAWRWFESLRPARVRTKERRYPICFVLAPARSGTTLFRAMLDVHDRLWAPGELHLAQFETMGQRADEIAPALLRHLQIPEMARRFDESQGETARRLSRWEREDCEVPVVYDALIKADPETLLVDKTPPYSSSIEHLARLGEWFPNAKFIHLRRNPVDVVRSLVRIRLYESARTRLRSKLNPYQISEMIWFESNTNIDRFLQEVPDDRKCRVRYEDLVSHSAEALEQVCRFLGTPYVADMADPYKARPGRVALGAGDMNVHRRSSVETRAPAIAFYPLAGRTTDLAARYGY